MAQVKITDLPQALALTGFESVPIVQNGVTVQTTTGAISVQPSQSQTFLTASQETSLPNSRYLSVGSGLDLNDSGSQGFLQVNLTGAAASLNTSPNGIQVKTAIGELTARAIDVGTGLDVTNANGVSGDPLIALGPFLSNIQSLSGSTGLVGVSGGVASPLAIVGTASNIDVTNGDGSTGNPTINLVSTGTPTGTFGSTSAIPVVTVDSFGRITNVTTAPTTTGGTVTEIDTGTGLTGGPITTSGTISLANTTVTAGTYGSATKIPQIVVNAQGQLTGVTEYSVVTGVSSVTGTANEITASPTSGDVVLSLPTALTFTGKTVTDGTFNMTAATVGSDTVTTNTATQTLTGKTISGFNNTLTDISNASLDNSSITIGTTGIALGDTVTTIDDLTLVTPTIASIVNTGTLTLPTSTDTLIARNTTDTLTNKSLSGSSNTFTNIPNSGLTNPSTTIGTTVATLGATTLTLGGLTSVAVTQDPTTALQLATKQYVDSVAQGLSAKAACFFTTTADILLTGLTTQAGGDWPSTLTAGDRILVKNQTLSQYNGIYVADALTWSRAADMNVWSEVPGSFVFVQYGSTLSSTGWTTTAATSGTIDVTAMPWVQFSGAGTYSAGTGLTLSGTQFSITNTAVTAASYGSASKTLTATVNAQGQLTAMADTDIAIAASQVTSGTLSVNRGGTGISSLTLNYIPYGNGTSAFNSSSSLQFDGTTLRTGTAALLGGATNPVLGATGGDNNYIQAYVYNATDGASSSADIVTYASNSSDAHGWADMGFTGPSYADPTYTVTGPNEAYLLGSARDGSFTGNLVYATDSTGSQNYHQWYVGGFTQLKSAWKMQLTSSGLTTAGTVTALGGITGGSF